MRDGVEYVTGELASVLRVLRESDVQVLEVEDGDVRLRLRRTLVDVPAGSVDGPPSDIAPPVTAPALGRITSPLVGTFFRAPTDGAPLVEVGAHVDIDSVVGIVEALQVLTEVEAGCRGRVASIHADDGQPVEYGQLLFEVDLDA
ncbi:MAG TPA: biotin/lipoyl-containing protein [Chloroflexota bacterium]|nr:biotin/lipoyl-containing protein [Chloroflexota bacterium]